MPRPAPAEAIFMKVSCLVLLLTASPEPRAVLNNNTFTLLPSPMEGAAPPPMDDRTMVGYELRKAGAKKMLARAAAPPLTVFVRQGRRVGSEEHTSELQSRLHLVCRLLLEKKKEADTS